MPTDTAPDLRPHARNFALRAVAWSVVLFGVMRLGWFQTHALLPLTLFQGRFAQSRFGVPSLPIEVTLACSGADAFGLCAAAILAYPAMWRMRLAGVALGTSLIFALNTMRIGTLGQAVASPAWFEALHLYLWPAAITLAIAGYVFAWMRFTDRRLTPAASDVASGSEVGPVSQPATPALRRFVILTAVFLALFTVLSPLYLESAGVLAVAAFIARAAAVALRLLGIQADASANVLSTARGVFLVTQECISTPLLPVYLAAAVAGSSSWPRRVLAVLATLPLFVALGVARLLVVALPVALGDSPLFLIHSFYQLLVAAVVVFVAARWRHGKGVAGWGRALLGLTIGGAFVYLFGPLYSHGLTVAFASARPFDDPQGAIALLPPFQLGLYVALSVAALAAFRWRAFAAGFATLAVSQIAVLAALHVLMQHPGLVPHVRDIRAWALAGPLLVVAAMVTYERPRR